MTALPRELFRIEPGTSDSWAFVLSTWLRSYAHSEWARAIDSGVYHHHHRAIAERLLDSAELRLASSTADGVYLGWSLRAPAVLHYVYVKQQFRRLGIARELLDGLDDFRISHRTADWVRMQRCNKCGGRASDEQHVMDGAPDTKFTHHPAERYKFNPYILGST